MSFWITNSDHKSVNKIPRELVYRVYEEDVCDTSGCAVVALRSFSGERRADF
jgi:hypothetical protein